MYRLLVRLAFPSSFRREFGEEIARLFESQLASCSSPRARVQLWMRAIADLAHHGAAERLAGVRVAASTGRAEIGRWRWWMHAFARDVRYAVRLLVRQPGLTFVAVATLALGIGANTAIFSAVNAVLLEPLPYAEPDRLVMVWEKRQAEGVLNNPVAPADFVDWARLNSSFEGIAGEAPVVADLTGRGDPVRLQAAGVSPAFFDVLRVTPMLGRTFRPDEATVGRHRVVILGYQLWQTRFGGDRGIVGSKIVLNGIPHEVVGVLPASFEFPDPTIDIWAPLALEGTPQPPTRAMHSLNVYARLKPGVALTQARTDMDQVAANLEQQYPDTNHNHGAHVVSMHEDLAAPVQSGLLLLLGAVAFVLLIACVNVANLLLAKAAGRRREMAVRVALGAGRGRLIGQALTESSLLGLAGGAMGLIVAHWGITLLRSLAPRGVPIVGLDRLGLDAPVLTFALVLSIATGLLFGLLPAWHLASQDANASLKDGGRSPGGVRRRLRQALVVSEIALASLLLVGTGLMLRSFQTLLRSEAGFGIDHRLTAYVSLPASRYREDDRVIRAFTDIESRLASIPGVRAVGAVNHLPLSGQNSRTGVAIEGREPVRDAPTRAHPRAVTPDYFRAMGIAVIAGRGFTRGDRADGPPVAIVNETMARAYWPGTSPLGRRVRLGGSEVWREVVGVIRDVRHWGLDQPVNPELYMPEEQYAWRGLNLVIATDGDPVSVAGAARERLHSIDPDLPLSNVRTMNEVAARSVASRRGAMLLPAVFGGLALMLAAAGIFGVMAHLVTVRTPEIGLRLTLGASPRAIMRLVITEGVLQTIAGLAIGLTAGVLVMGSLRAVLVGVRPFDPATLAAVATVLAVTAVAACLIPAWRAMRVDPATAIRAADSR